MTETVTCPHCGTTQANSPAGPDCEECGRVLPTVRPPRRKARQAPLSLILSGFTVALAVVVAAVIFSAFRATIAELPVAADGPMALPSTTPTRTPAAVVGLEIPSALARLRDGSPEARAEAAAWLARRPPEAASADEVVPVLRSLLKDPAPPVRLSAAAALCGWASPEEVPVLLALLADGQFADVRPALVKALGRLGDPRAGAALASLLSGSGEADLAADALAAIGSGAEPAVLPYLFHPDDKARPRALRVLNAAGTRPATTNAAAIRELAGDDPERVRLALAWLAAAAPTAAERPAVTAKAYSLLRPGDEGVREAAAGTLAAWAERGQWPQLARCLEDHNPAVRQAAVAALGRSRDRDVLPLLVRHLRVAEDRTATTRAVAAFGPAAEFEVLTALNARDPETRAAACRVLASVGTVRSRDVLTALLNDPDREVAVAARSAMQAVMARR